MMAIFFLFGKMEMKSCKSFFGDWDDFEELPYGRSVTIPSTLSLIFCRCSYPALIILELNPFDDRFFFAILHIFLSKSIPMERIPIDSASSNMVPEPQNGSHKVSFSFNPARLTIALLSFQ